MNDQEVTMQQIKAQLEGIEEKLRGLREERARAVKVREAAKAAVAASPDGEEGEPAYQAAQASVTAVNEIEQRIDAEQQRQMELLKSLGDYEHGRSGFTLGGVSGWEKASRELDLGRGELRVGVEAASLVAQSVSPTPPAPSFPRAVPVGGAGAADATAPGTTNRWTYPVFNYTPFGPSPGDLVTTDFVVSFTQDPASGLTGVERVDPAASTPDKTTLPLSAALATPAAHQFAVIAEALPAVIFNNQGALQQLLSVEMGRRLSEAIDSHVVDTIEATSGLPSGSTGANLIERIRNGIASMHNAGGAPSVIALTPGDAATLDLSTDAGGYVFVRIAGTAGQQTVWRLAVRESPSVNAPLLIDPERLGVLFLGNAEVLADPFSSLKQNLVRVRVEAEGRMHVRNIRQGARAIA